jgi:hypothetical protein
MDGCDGSMDGKERKKEREKEIIFFSFNIKFMRSVDPIG